MNYKKVYDAIIQHTKQRNLKKLPKNSKNYIYLETHHIIPKSLGGNDDESNLVNLTAREHFICHLLLMKITNDINMILAVNYLSDKFKNPKYNVKINSRIYSMIKTEFSKMQSKRTLGENNPMFGSKYKWINNGKQNKRLLITEPIPDNFVLGRIQKLRTDKGLYIFCHNPITKQSKKILKTDNLPEGYILGIYVSAKRRINAKKQMAKINERRKLDKKPAWNKGLKNQRIWITNGIIEKQFDINQPIPENFYKGKLPKSIESRIKISNSKKGKKSNFIWITNGIVEMHVKKDCNIPNGFHKGKLKGTINSGKIFVNNGTITIRVYPDDIPSGFVKGICKKSYK